jgi:hypothetical protein
VLLEMTSAARLPDVQLELRDPPAGITLVEAKVQPKGVSLTLKADGEAAKSGLAGNLILEAFAGSGGGTQRDGKPGGAKQRTSYGILPAIPFEVISDSNIGPAAKVR